MLIIISVVAAVLIIIILIDKSINHPAVKGMIGERRVQKQLKKLPVEDYKILNNVMIKKKIGTSQIDHIVISPYGIFVIETKNYGGYVYGNENSDYWTQKFYKSKIKFRNPIKQNWGHVYALKDILPEYKDVSFYPIIIFAGKSKLDINSKTCVISPEILYETIMRHRGSKQLTSNEMEQIYDMLKSNNLEDKQIKREHVNRIKWNVKIREMKERVLICPECGGHLIKRKSRYGAFYGCENFPKCKFKGCSLEEEKNDKELEGHIPHFPKPLI